MIYNALASEAVLKKTADNLKNSNFNVEIAENKQEALKKIKELIPKDASVMNGSSKTLEQIGFIEYLKSGKHHWKNLHEAILRETDPKKQSVLRKQSSLADYFLGSVHAVTENGEVLIASASGNQLPAYAFSAQNVIWVAGTQKIVPDFNNGLKRIYEYVYPLEDKRMKDVGYAGSGVNKILIMNKEIMPLRKITMIFVKEKLGF